MLGDSLAALVLPLICSNDGHPVQGRKDMCKVSWPSLVKINDLIKMTSELTKLANESHFCHILCIRKIYVNLWSKGCEIDFHLLMEVADKYYYWDS